MTTYELDDYELATVMDGLWALDSVALDRSLTTRERARALRLRLMHTFVHDVRAEATPTV